MRLAFLGTPDPAASVLRALVRAGHEVEVVVTRADKRRGRRQAPTPSPVKAAALELGLPVSEKVDDVVASGARLAVVVAFGRVVPAAVLERIPMVNVHYSLLPRWRGAAPVERAILAGDRVTGVSLMALEEGLDTGPVYRRAEVAIRETETAAELTGRLTELGAALLVQALHDGLGDAAPQQGEPTYAPKIDPGELRIDWAAPAEEIHRVVRVGRAWTTWRGRRLLVIRASVTEVPAGTTAGHPGAGELVGDVVATGSGGLRLLEVQPEGRSPQAAEAWLRGARPAAGERLGS